MIISLAPIGGVQTITVTVDPQYPTIWREEGYHRQLQNLARTGLHVDDKDRVHVVQVRVDNRVWLVLPDRDVEITKGSYIVKLANPGHWDVELFDNAEQAQSRVSALTATM